jgi:hypothetical protein
VAVGSEGKIGVRKCKVLHIEKFPVLWQICALQMKGLGAGY